MQYSMKGAQLIEFKEYLKVNYKNKKYSKNIKTMDLNRKEIKERTLPIILDGKWSKVADESMKCPGNIYLKKQSEDYRIRMILKENIKTKEFIMEKYKLSRLIFSFFILLAIVNTFIIVIDFLDSQFLKQTSKSIESSLNSAEQTFTRVTLLTTSHDLLIASGYFNEYFFIYQ